MEYNYLPDTNIKVSKICLGTMTWGRQNTQEEAFEQMNFSLENGVNFFDTAELYPVPATPDKYADTEKIIGNWFSKTGKRDKVILATKIAGPGDYTAHIRKTGFKGDSINEAIEGSLKDFKLIILIYINCIGLKELLIHLATEVFNIIMILGRIILRRFYIF